MLMAVLGIAVTACAKVPAPRVTDEEDSSSARASLSIAPKNASRQAAKMLATIDDRPDCDEFRVAIQEAGAGSPVAGTTQRAFIEARKAAREAGCLLDQ